MRLVPQGLRSRLYGEHRVAETWHHLAPALVRNEPLHLVDIGSRGGVPPEWTSLGSHVSVLGFEPDADECDRLNDHARREGSGHRYVAVAVADTAGERILNLTRKRAASSLLEPNQAFHEQFPESERIEVVEQRPVDVRPLGEVLAEVGWRPEFVKCDAQGLDGAILASLQDPQWSDVLGVHVEIAVAPQYAGQSRLGEVHDLLEQHGLQLFYLRRYSARRKSFDTGRYWSRGQLTEVDALFLRLPDGLSADQRLRLAAVAAAYFHYDYAHEIVHDLDPAAAEQILQLARRRLPGLRPIAERAMDAGQRLTGPPRSPWNADSPHDWV